MAKRVSLKGRGADLFFGDLQPPPDAPPPGELGGALPQAKSDEVSGSTPVPRAGDGAAPSHLAETAAPSPPAPAPQRARNSAAPGRKNASAGASTLASNRANPIVDLEREEVDAIRRVVKQPGKEVSFVRLSPEEKGELADVVYASKRRGLKTSETEINRIAINALLADYRAHGERSILAQVLAALRA